MATVQSFEELEIWKKAQEIGMIVYQLCKTNQSIAADFSFKDQIKRAALSISNNIAEGFEYSNNNDFWRFLRIVKGSCGEVKNCLLFAVKVGFATNEEVEKIVAACRLLGSQIGSLMKYLKQNKVSQKISK